MSYQIIIKDPQFEIKPGDDKYLNKFKEVKNNWIKRLRDSNSIITEQDCGIILNIESVANYFIKQQNFNDESLSVLSQLWLLASDEHNSKYETRIGLLQGIIYNQKKGGDDISFISDPDDFNGFNMADSFSHIPRGFTPNFTFNSKIDYNKQDFDNAAAIPLYDTSDKISDEDDERPQPPPRTDSMPVKRPIPQPLSDSFISFNSSLSSVGVTELQEDIRNLEDRLKDMAIIDPSKVTLAQIKDVEKLTSKENIRRKVKGITESDEKRHKYEIQRCNGEIQRYAEELRQSKSETQHYRLELDKLYYEFDRYKQEAKEEYKTELRNYEIRWNEENKELERQYAEQFRDQEQQYSSNMKEYEKQYTDKVTDMNHQQQSMIEQYATEIAASQQECQSEINRLRDENILQNEQYKERIQELTDRLQLINYEHTKEIDDLNKQHLMDKSSAVADVDAKVTNHFRGEMADLTNRYRQQMAQMNTQFEAETNKYNHAINEYQSKIHELSRRVLDSESKVGTENPSIEIEKMLNEYKKLNDHLSIVVNNKTAEIEEFRKKLSTRIAENRQLQYNIQQLQETLAQMASEIKRSQEHRESMEAYYRDEISKLKRGDDKAEIDKLNDVISTYKRRMAMQSRERWEEVKIRQEKQESDEKRDRREKEKSNQKGKEEQDKIKRRLAQTDRAEKKNRKSVIKKQKSRMALINELGRDIEKAIREIEVKQDKLSKNEDESTEMRLNDLERKSIIESIETLKRQVNRLRNKKESVAEAYQNQTRTDVNKGSVEYDKTEIPFTSDMHKSTRDKHHKFVYSDIIDAANVYPYSNYYGAQENF